MLNKFLKILENPFCYELFQGVIGQPKSRRKPIQDYLSLKTGMRILDIGCGPGYVSKMVKDCEYIGFDIDAKYIAYAQKKYGAYGKFHCGILTKEDLQKLPPFDVVMLNGVLHHVDDATAKEILILSRFALRNGGTLLTADPCFVPDQNPIAKFLAENDRGDFVRDYENYPKLAQNLFHSVTYEVRTDLLHFIPCTALIMKCEVSKPVKTPLATASF